MTAKNSNVLEAIKPQVEESHKLISAGTALTRRFTGIFSGEWFRQLSSEMKDHTRRTIATNIAIYKTVTNLQGMLPSFLERSLDQEPFVLEDAIGRIILIYL